MSMTATGNGTSYPTVGRPEGRRVGATIGIAAIMVLVIAAAYLTIGELTGDKAKATSLGWHAVPGGSLQIDDIERISSGPRQKRFELTATIKAGEKALVVDRSSFRITGYHVYLGMKPISASPAVKRIRAGQTSQMTLTYAVANDAGDLSLIFEGSRAPIRFQLSDFSPSS